LQDALMAGGKHDSLTRTLALQSFTHFIRLLYAIFMTFWM